MANWRQQTLDQAITRARKNGFSDPDFDGWDELDGLTRITVVNQILHHNGEGQIIFRKSFAKAFYGVDPHHVWHEIDPKTQKLIEAFSCTNDDYHRRQCVIADDWLAYLREYMRGPMSIFNKLQRAWDAADPKPDLITLSRVDWFRYYDSLTPEVRSNYLKLGFYCVYRRKGRPTRKIHAYRPYASALSYKGTLVVINETYYEMMQGHSSRRRVLDVK